MRMKACDGIDGRRRLKVAALSINPAPYRDPVFAEVHRRGNIELHVLTMFAAEADHPYRREAAPEYLNTPLGKGFKLLRHSWLHPGIVPALRRGMFDAIIVPGYSHATAVLAMLFCWATATPLIFSCDSVDFGEGSRRRARLLRLILRHAAAAWVPGAQSRSYLRQLGFAADRIFEGAYCLDCERLIHFFQAREPARDALRESLRIDNAGFMFLFVGRMIAPRGLTHLVRAFADLSALEKDAFLVLVGDGPVRDDVARLAQSLRLNRFRIIAPTDFDTLRNYYLAADAYVMPALREPYSLALAQAAIFGLPVVTTANVGAVADYVPNAETGTIVPAGDSVALKDAMLKLVRNRSLAQTVGRAGQQLARSRTVDWGADQLERAALRAVSRETSDLGHAVVGVRG